MELVELMVPSKTEGSQRHPLLGHFGTVVQEEEDDSEKKSVALILLVSFLRNLPTCLEFTFSVEGHSETSCDSCNGAVLTGTIDMVLWL